MHEQGIQLVPEFFVLTSDIFMPNIDTLNNCIKKFDVLHLIFDKMVSF